jgi:hypothetical protein
MFSIFPLLTILPPEQNSKAQYRVYFLPRAGWLALLDQGLAREEREAIYRVLRDAVPDFSGVAA